MNLAAISSDETGSIQKDFPSLYKELRSIAARQLRYRKSGETLQPTVLVHEAYVKFASSEFKALDRKHLLCTAAKIMRQIIVDHARLRGSKKRGGNYTHVQVDTSQAFTWPCVDVLVLDEALSRLAQYDERQARVVELRFFADLTFDEIAVLTDQSARNAKRDWEMARAWLQRELKRIPHG
jgi:RNA polymerase sigma-70 factor (ECF subfamily)